MSIRSKIILTVLCLTALLLSFPTMAEESGHQVDPSVAVLFTNDIHSNYDQDIGYDGLMILIPSATAASTACSSSSYTFMLSSRSTSSISVKLKAAMTYPFRTSHMMKPPISLVLRI